MLLTCTVQVASGSMTGESFDPQLYNQWILLSVSTLYIVFTVSNLPIYNNNLYFMYYFIFLLDKFYLPIVYLSTYMHKIKSTNSGVYTYIAVAACRLDPDYIWWEKCSNSLLFSCRYCSFTCITAWPMTIMLLAVWFCKKNCSIISTNLIEM